MRLVANLPYSISGPVLRRLLDLHDTLVDWSVMLQREVAARLDARPGERDYGSFAVLHALTAEVEVVAELAPGAFFPVPKVVSSFARVVPRVGDALSNEELLAVERVARAAFGKRRKTLVNALRGGGFGDKVLGAVEALGIDPRARAETLEPVAFRRLTAQLSGR